MKVCPSGKISANLVTLIHSRFVRLRSASVTRWLVYFSIFGHLHGWKIAQWDTKLVKVGSKICQIFNKLSKHSLNLIRLPKSGENLPNLVTMRSAMMWCSECTDWKVKTKMTAQTLEKIFFTCFKPRIRRDAKIDGHKKKTRMFKKVFID